ncbi:MAG: hypothetical protein IPI10_08835 [Bacteroidetes bacterium]|nr:hypothetical protein [Bacteroidota bacterium]
MIDSLCVVSNYLKQFLDHGPPFFSISAEIIMENVRENARKRTFTVVNG